MTKEQLDQDIAEKASIELSARAKFEHLSDQIEGQFKKHLDAEEIGEAFQVLYKNGFTDREAARFIMFIQNL